MCFLLPQWTNLNDYYYKGIHSTKSADNELALKYDSQYYLLANI